MKKRPNIFEIAIKLKNRNQQENHRYNKLSIFNIAHLNKILTASGDHKNDVKTDRKIKSHRDFSLVLRSPTKIYTSLSQRAKFNGEMNAIEKRNLRSSADSRNLFQNKHSVDSP